METSNLITIKKAGIDHVFVSHDKDTDYFVKDIFKDWEEDTFRVFEECKNPDGVAIDLGAWIGTTAIWLSKNFKHVLAVESDTNSLLCLKNNLAASDCNNVSICERPIFSTSEMVPFGPRGKKLNESISYIKRHSDTSLDYQVKSLTVKQLLYDYVYQNTHIQNAPITFIKCDIEGGEENIIEDLLYFAYYENVKVYLSFHLDFFQTHTISDFGYLFDFFISRTADGAVVDAVVYLSENHMGSLLFESTYRGTGKTLIKKNMPVCIQAYNQYTYVKNMVEQLRQYTNDIIVIDNNSTFEPLLNYYNTVFPFTLLRQDKNYGSKSFLSPSVQHLVGDVYLLTDPDLEFNKNIPKTWIRDLVDVLTSKNASRVGFALDISDPNIRTDITYSGKSITEWESQFWKEPIHDPTYELYAAPIDTTLCLINRKQTNDLHIRVAGPYTCRHLPWYTDYKNNLLPGEDVYYLKGNIATNWF